MIMQIRLGAVYGWSVFLKPLMAAEQWVLTQVSLTFTLAIPFLGAEPRSAVAPRVPSVYGPNADTGGKVQYQF